MFRNEETTFNVTLANVLRAKIPHLKRGVGAEQLGAMQDGGRPDILVLDTVGTPVVVETEFAPARGVEQEAESRLGRSLRNDKMIEHAIALTAPKELRDVGQVHLQQAVHDSSYEYCLYYMDETAVSLRWPEQGNLFGSVNNLADLIETCLVPERILKEALDNLQRGVLAADKHFQNATEQLPDVRQAISQSLYQPEGEQTYRMAMVIIANALTFQIAISGKNDIPNLDQLRHDGKTLLKRDVVRTWGRILDEINYWPIFNIARNLIVAMPDGLASKVLGILADVAQYLAGSDITKSHDLTGRLFQRLILDRKLLATFYTLPVSAVLLAELAVGGGAMEGDEVTKFRIADLACGTGTLLSAAYQSVLSRHRRTGGDDRVLHKAMMEKAIIAADIMPIATHLTTSMLSGVHPTTTFEKTCIYTIPYGTQPADKDIAIGSLDLLDSEYGTDLFGTDATSVRGRDIDSEIGKDAWSKEFPLQHGHLDVVIMNPPFTRQTNHAITDERVPSFAGFQTTPEEQALMAKKLKRIQSQISPSASHGNAGLASSFLDLAHLKLRNGGVLAMVMPLALVSGKAWEKSRMLLAQCFQEIRLVSIAANDSKDAAFSADTNMGEVLVVARKCERRCDASVDKVPTDYITLARRPRSRAESIEIARKVIECSGTSEKCRSIELGDVRVGSIYRSSLGNGGCASVSDLELADVVAKFKAGRISFPGDFETYCVPTTCLGELGERGPLHRDITETSVNTGPPRGPFKIHDIRAGEQVTFPVLWAHNAEAERCLIVDHDKAAEIRPNMEPKARDILAKATNLHFTLDFGLSSQSLAACWTRRKSIGGTAWPNFVTHDEAHAKVLLLWSNTTLGLMLFWWIGNRQQSGRARVTISKLPELPIIDPRKLSFEQLRIADQAFCDFSALRFLPASEAYHDPARIDLDKTILFQMLNIPSSTLPSLDLLRKKWCAEPTVHGGSQNRISS